MNVARVDKDRVFTSTDSEDGMLRLYTHEQLEGFAAPDFWPPGDSYHVGTVGLDARPLQAFLPDQWDDLVRLVHLANAIRTLQAPNGSALSPAVGGLVQQSARILDDLSVAMMDRDKDIAEVLRLRAADLASGTIGPAATKQAELQRDDLLVLCGSLTSWRSKTNQLLHSAVVGMENRPLTEALEDLDTTYENVLAFIRDILELSNLSLVPVPRFSVADMALCGGEANQFPKHFSYFLPEDEGVKRAPNKKTAVFINIYMARFEQVSLPLYETFCGVINPVTRRHLSDPMWLLTWFKGHDTGHSVRMPTTDWVRLREIGFDASVALQEVIADVVGYLTVAQPWNLCSPADLRAAGTAVLAELLRYLRRGAPFFPDSAAAFMELSFLHERGFVGLNPETGSIHWEPEGLFEGMRALASQLLKAVLEPDMALVHELLGRYSHWKNRAFQELVSRLMPAANSLPQDMGYTVITR